MLRVRSVEPLDGYWLRLHLTNGDVIERNVRDLLNGRVFESLRADYREFQRARVRWGTVVWPGKLDLDPDVLIWDGPAPTDPASRPRDRLTLQRLPAIAHLT
jgi:hypothetical protein